MTERAFRATTGQRNFSIDVNRLRTFIIGLKEEFNKKLIALRDKKVSLIVEMKQLVGELEDVQGKLSESEHLPVPNIPEMLAEELPETETKYTNETLVMFRKVSESISSSVPSIQCY